MVNNLCGVFTLSPALQLVFSIAALQIPSVCLPTLTICSLNSIPEPEPSWTLKTLFPNIAPREEAYALLQRIHFHFMTWVLAAVIF